MTSRPVRVLLVALSLTPVLAALWFIAIHGQPVPFWDEWIEPVDNAIKTADGTLEPSDLVRQYNDSRPFFTNLLTVASTLALSWDLKAEMFFNQVLAAVTLSLLFVILRRRLGARALAALPLLALLVFSLTQRRSLLWAIQSQYYFLLLFVVAAFACLDADRRKWAAVSGAAALACCATFSFANGFLIWIVMLPVLALHGYRSRKFVGFWLLACGCCTSLYFWGYDFRGALGEGMSDPLTVAGFTLAALGNALVGHHGPVAPSMLAIIASLGAAGVLLFAADAAAVHRWSRSRRSRWAVWLGFALFAVASCGLAAVGRIATMGIAGGLANRYVTLSLLFWIALVGLGAETVHRGASTTARPRWAQVLVAANLVFGILFLGTLVVSNIRAPFAPRRVTPEHRACLERAAATGDLDCLRGLHPVFDPGHPSFGSRHLAMEKIERMADLELGVFSRYSRKP